MITECNEVSFDFQPLGTRQVTAQFDGGIIASDGGGVLLREIEKRTGIIRKFAACFRDYRDPELVEFSTEELLAQRIYGLCLEYEDVNDHDDLRRDPLLALLVGRPDPTGQNRENPRDRGKPLAGKRTLNRLELTPPGASVESRYKKIASNTDRSEECVEQLTAELDLRFPVAIDEPGENGVGKTFSAFRLNTIPQTFLIDPQGKMHHVERGKLPDAIYSTLKEAGVEDLPRLGTHNLPQMPDQARGEVNAVWREMARRAPATGKIYGCVTDGNAAINGAEAVAKLNLHILSTHSLFSTARTPFKAENDFRAASDASGAYELGGLSKGIYEFTFAAPGKARVERQVIIKPDLTPETLDVVLDQDDGIVGRVVEEAGQAVAGARVHPRDWHFDRENPWPYKSGSLHVDDAVTDERGEFSLQGLYQGAWSCDVIADGFVKGELTQIPPGSKAVVVNLKRAKAAQP